MATVQGTGRNEVRWKGGRVMRFWMAVAVLGVLEVGCAMNPVPSTESTGSESESLSSVAYHTQMLRPYDIDRSATFTGGRAYWWARCDDSSDPRWMSCYVTAGAGVAYIDEEGHCRVDLDGGSVTVRLVGYCR